MLTKAEIVNLLKTNDKAIAKALVVINKNQTATEQRSETTINRNGEGFRPCHARMGTSMAEFFQRNGYLSPKQIAYWRKEMADGNMRIGIYWRQLAEAAEAKKASKTASVQQAIDSIKEKSHPIVSAVLASVHPDEIEMQRMEAEADRAQTERDEFNKMLARRRMERH